MTSSSATGDGNANGAIQASLFVTVIGAPVPYHFSGSVFGPAGAADLERRENDGGGWEWPRLFEVSDSSFTTSGVFGLGSYRIKMNVGSSSDVGDGSFNFTFTIGEPAP